MKLKKSSQTAGSRYLSVKKMSRKIINQRRCLLKKSFNRV